MVQFSYPTKISSNLQTSPRLWSYMLHKNQQQSANQPRALVICCILLLHTLAVYSEPYAAAQEISEKAPQLPQDIKWHFIGHLQSNKAKAVVGMCVCTCISTAGFEQISAAVYYT